MSVHSSDGVLEVTNERTGQREANGPTRRQLDSTRDAKGTIDYFVVVPEDDIRNIEFRIQLAMTVMKEMLNNQLGREEGRTQSQALRQASRNLVGYNEGRCYLAALWDDNLASEIEG
jgi:hypothetical protein